MEELLSTKLFTPPTRPELVHRPRLIARLNTGLHQKLTLISAPAGFGKTTLVTEWLATRPGHVNNKNQIDTRIAWLSLDEDDNDPTRFLTYFIAALNQVKGIDATFGQDALGMLQSPQPPPTEITVTSLINEMAAIPGQILLILDDYHLIEAQSVHDGLSFLLDNMPPQMHLVIATREDPPLHLARLRAGGQLTELRAADLRFTSAEAAEFLNQVMGLHLSTADIVALGTRTEGWIAGLQLAAISMQGHADAPGLIRSFTGSHRFVLDYLIEEVLEQQPESVQNFLLQTAILRRLTGSLCNAVTGQANGKTTLEMLEHANLFILPLDEERRWYRYHHLFTDLLRHRLRQTQADHLPILHRRASEWYEQNGFVNEAITYALRAEAFSRAAHLIEAEAERTWANGEDTKLRLWLDELPVDIVCAKPELCVFHAWSLLATGQQELAESRLACVERILDSSSVLRDRDRSPDPGRMMLHGRVAATRAFMAFYHGNVPGMVQFSRQALEYLPREDLSWRSTAINTLADAHAFNGEAVAAYRTRAEAVEVSQAAGNSYQIIIANLKLAIALRQLGELPRVIDICQQQLQFANENDMTHTIVVGWLLAIWGEVLAEINDLDGATQRATKGVELTEHGGDLAMLGWSYICLIRVLFSKGDITGVDEIINKMENAAHENGMPPWITNVMTAWQVRIWLTENKLGAADQWAKKCGLNADQDPTTYSHEMEYITLVRILIAQGRVDRASRVLSRLLISAETGGRTSRVIEILMLQSLAFQAEGEPARANATLEQCLVLAEPGGFMRAFVDEGPPMESLLKKIKLTNGQLNKTIRTLLAAFGDKGSQPSSDSLQPLIEPLSEREIEVLQLIAEGLTNQEIATRLYLSLNTVKVHTRNINGKLGVHNRTKAVASARALGVLPST